MVSPDPKHVAACCGSSRWQALMLESLPEVISPQSLEAAADRAFSLLTSSDWLEAFADHSAIGAPRAGDLRGAAEQAGVQDADAGLRAAIGEANQAYQQRFGFVFLIRARGRSAAEILAQLRTRLENPPEIEFQIACDQQRQITCLRLMELWR